MVIQAQNFEGQCLCGAVRYRVTGVPESCCFCHCYSCQRGSGAPVVAWVTFSDRELTLLQGALRYCHTSEKVTRGYCAECGSSLTYAHEDRPGRFDLTLATLDDPGAITPEAHIWISNKVPWLKLDDGLPQYSEWRTR